MHLACQLAQQNAKKVLACPLAKDSTASLKNIRAVSTPSARFSNYTDHVPRSIPIWSTLKDLYVVIPLRFKGKEIGNSPRWPLQGNLSGSSTDPFLLFFALLLDCAWFTSWRGNLSASPSAKPSGCDRAGGVKFTGWRMSRLELLLTQ